MCVRAMDVDGGHERASEQARLTHAPPKACPCLQMCTNAPTLRLGTPHTRLLRAQGQRCLSSIWSSCTYFALAGDLISWPATRCRSLVEVRALTRPQRDPIRVGRGRARAREAYSFLASQGQSAFETGLVRRVNRHDDRSADCAAGREVSTGTRWYTDAVARC